MTKFGTLSQTQEPLFYWATIPAKPVLVTNLVTKWPFQANFFNKIKRGAEGRIVDNYWIYLDFSDTAALVTQYQSTLGNIREH